MRGVPSEPEQEPLVFVLVVNWNRWYETMGCVASVLRSTYPRFEVVVIDNGSLDIDEALLPDGVELVQTGRNLGYAGGNNVGIRQAVMRNADYMWILNNDAQPEPQALTELVAAAEADLSGGALTSLILTPKGIEDTGLLGNLPTGQRWDPVLRLSPRLPETVSSLSRESVESIDLLRGPSILLRRAAIEQIGLFDESYFHYLEEIDLMERLTRAGWRLGFVRGSRVRHAKGASLPYNTPQSLYYLHRNHFHFERKLFGAHPLRVASRHPLRRLRSLFAVRHTLRGDFRPLNAQLRALADALRGKDGPVDLGERYRLPLGARPRSKPNH
jgi:GT2 family glycosyltransferase